MSNLLELLFLIHFFLNRVGGGEDFDDDADDDNIDDQDEDVAFEIIPAGQSGGSVAKNKRITTKYMTK